MLWDTFHMEECAESQDRDRLGFGGSDDQAFLHGVAQLIRGRVYVAMLEATRTIRHKRDRMEPPYFGGHATGYPVEPDGHTLRE